MHNSTNQVNNQDLKDLAWGPMRSVFIWPIFIVNGFRFHIKSWADGRKTDNSGVYVKGNTHTGSEGEYYGILQEVVQIHYAGTVERTLFLFNCEWFDPSLNRGTRMHSRYKLIEVKKSKRYAKYDPFIMAHQAQQCYYASYPTKVRDKMDWYAVIKTKPRAVVDIKNIIEIAHQEEEMSGFNQSVTEVEQIASLVDENIVYEEHVAAEVSRDTSDPEPESNEDEEETDIDTDDSEDDTTEHTTDFHQDDSDE